MYIWLSNQIGASAANITISFAFCIITLIAITTIILFLRRLNRGRMGFSRKKCPSRLTLRETITLDRNRRLILVGCDDKEHLLLIGGLTDIVVESNISATTQKRETQPTLTTKTNKNTEIIEKRSSPAHKNEHTQEGAPILSMNKKVEDSAITAEIEGRQEPSLFIPAQDK
ncbi:hypothetical protein ABID23_001076 [Bartonella silvatica]|uniref:Flagellar biosynthetic protein FliO n=1 Tax=Bartonella silvatica TaxID=357760 RepID=A0ABV2HHH3_9HYPH